LRIRLMHYGMRSKLDASFGPGRIETGVFVLERDGMIQKLQEWARRLIDERQQNDTGRFDALAPSGWQPVNRPVPQARRVPMLRSQAQRPAPQSQRSRPTATNPLLNQIVTEARAIHEELRRLNIDAAVDPKRCTPGGNQLAFYGIALQGKTKAADVARVLPELSRAISQARRTRVTLRFDEITLRLEAEHPQKQPLHWTPRRMEMTQPHAMTLGISHHNGAQLVTARFDDAPHILVAGETGSGKSVLLRNLVTSLAYATSPDDLRIAIIDLKNEDMIPFAKLPHIVAFAGDRGAAVDVIQMIQAEKQERIADPNRKPYRLLLLVDELAQLVPVKGALDNLGDIMSVGRSKSINVIAATQSPTEDGGMGSMMKANIPLRLIGAVSAGQSYTATRRKNAQADMLPGKGAFLYIAGAELYRFQTFMLDSGDVARAVREIRSRWRLAPVAPVQRRPEISPEVAQLAPPLAPVLHHPAPVQAAPVAPPFPLDEKRPLTMAEAALVQALAEGGESLNAICHYVYGAKSSRYMRWINEAIGGKDAQ